MLRRMIHKYPLDITTGQDVMMPQGAKILTVQLQGDQPMLWAIVNPEESKVPHRIICKGTGHSFDAAGEVGAYIATIQQDSYVWHFFQGYK